MQQDIDQVEILMEKLHMEYSLDECEVMCFGWSNPRGNFKVNGRSLPSIDAQIDLGACQ